MMLGILVLYARRGGQVPESASPTVRRRRLAAELRRLRERASLTGDQVAEHMRWSASKVSRIENAHTNVRTTEVKKLLGLYGVGGSDADELLALAQEATRKGWWEAYSDALPDAYTAFIGLEAEAAWSRQWATDTFPGLLQTEDYAREVISSHIKATTAMPPGEIEMRVKARMARQQILERDPPFRVDIVLDQAVLRRRFVHENSVMLTQLKRLITVSEYSTVSIRVLPLDACHPIAAGGFILLRFAQAHDVTYHDIVCIEHVAGSAYFEAERDTYQYELAFDRLSELSLSCGQSRDVIVRAQSIWE